MNRIPFSRALNLPLSSLIKIPFFIYSSLVLVFFLSGADLALGRNGLMPVPPTLAALILVGSLAIIGIVIDLQKKPAGAQCLAILGKNQAPILAFLIVVIISLLFSGHPTAYWGEGAKWIFLIGYGFLIFMAAMLLPLSLGSTKTFTFFPIFAVVILLASMLVDVYNPGYFSSELSRAAGFPGNSNLASIITILLCAASINYNLEGSLLKDFSVFTLGTFAMVLTQSRSGIVELAVLLLFYIYINFTKRRVRGKTIVLCFLGISGLLTILALVVPVVLSNSSMFQQYNTRFSHVLSSSQIDDGSSDSRMEAVVDSIRLVNASPVLGHGTGFSRTMAELPHNIYLQQWVNNGICGLVAYLSLLVCAFYLFWKRKFYPGQALILVAGVGGLFSHNMLDQRPFLMLFGMLLTISLRRV